jgi:hypothetical protein
VRRLFATLLAAGVSTAIFVVVRNDLDLEESRFIHALLAFSAVGFALSVTSSILLGGSMRSSLALGVVASLLVSSSSACVSSAVRPATRKGSRKRARGKREGLREGGGGLR